METLEQATTLFDQGLTAMREGKYRAAIGCFEQALRLQPEDSELIIELTRLHKNARKHAGLEITTPIDVAQRVTANREHGQAALDVQHYERAFAYFTLVLRDQPDDESTHEALNRIRHVRGTLPEVAPSGAPFARSLPHVRLIVAVGAPLLLLLVIVRLLPFGGVEESTPAAAPVVDTPSAVAAMQDTAMATATSTPGATPRPTTPAPGATPRPTTPVPGATAPSATPRSSPTATASLLPTGVVETGGPSLNVREGAGTNFQIQAGDVALEPGETVEILSQQEGNGCDEANNIWFEIRMNDEREGWVCSQFVRLAPGPRSERTPPDNG
jgi:hypothetical protein